MDLEAAGRLSLLAKAETLVRSAAASGRERSWLGGDATLAAAIAAIAFAARFYHIAAMPYWLDEWLTVRRAEMPLPQLVADSLGAHHVPTYFLLIAGLAHWATGEAVLRLPSALFGALAAGLVFAIGAAAGSRRAGLVAGFLMACAPLQVQYGQEARSYTMAIALLLLGLLGAVELAAMTDAGSARPPARRRRAWFAYIAGTAGALNVLSIAVPWFLAAQPAFLAMVRRADAAMRRRVWRMQLLVAALFLPAAAALLLFPHASIGNGFDWIPPLKETLWSSVAGVYLFHTTNLVTLRVSPEAIPGFGLALVILAALGAWRLRRRPMILIVLGVALLAMPLALLGLSVVKSVLMPRYLLWSAAPFFVFAGLGIDALPRRVRNAAAAAIALLAVLSLLPYYQDETKPRWDLATQYLASHAGASDVVFVGSDLIEMQLELMQANLNGAKDTQSVDQAAEALAEGKRVWALYGHVGQEAMPQRDAFLARLSPLGRPSDTIPVGKSIVIFDFTPSPAL